MPQEISTSYKGNQQLKRNHVALEFSKEEIEDYIKSSKDIVYFTEKFIKIVHPDSGLIPLNLHDYQKDMLIHLNENRNSVLLASRQVGKCFSGDININVRNKKTGEILELPIRDFHEMCRNSKNI